jgi:uncharacterized membrane protein YagU involved in acid resistance
MHPIVAGVAATAAMSVVVRAAQALNLLQRPPPASITERALGLPPSTVHVPTAIVNGAAHLAYGAMLAVPFAALRRAAPLRSYRLLPGMAYGLAVYVANYEALLPALSLMPAAHRDTTKRVSTMIGAHLVYGAVLDQLLANR